MRKEMGQKQSTGAGGGDNCEHTRLHGRLHEDDRSTSSVDQILGENNLNPTQTTGPTIHQRHFWTTASHACCEPLRAGQCETDPPPPSPLWQTSSGRTGIFREEQTSSGRNRHLQGGTDIFREEQTSSGRNRQLQGGTDIFREEQTSSGRNRHLQGGTDNLQEEQTSSGRNRHLQGGTDIFREAQTHWTHIELVVLLRRDSQASQRQTHTLFAVRR
ncbi:hypothetical protein WMY93_034094 [Mugilogobius chulae]|uniref:Uncharacterized protein n=1 Tax=Mugilogobius chulae TaxID=88201 RepID=A0AAW0MLR5_9GOBI